LYRLILTNLKKKSNLSASFLLKHGISEYFAHFQYYYLWK